MDGEGSGCANNDGATGDGSGGGWMGIDLGTSNSCAAVWDASRSRCKVLRLGHMDLAPPHPSGGKGGKIVPSAVLFRRRAQGDDAAGVTDACPPGRRCRIPGLAATVGHAAIEAQARTPDPDTVGGGNRESDAAQAATVTSFKRIVGMTSKQARKLQASNPDFWNSLPFQPEIVEDDANASVDGAGDDSVGNNEPKDAVDASLLDVLGNAVHAQGITGPRKCASQPEGAIKEGVAIRIRPLCGVDSSHNSQPKDMNIEEECRSITPLQVTTILLQSIRAAAVDYLTNDRKGKRIQAPGLKLNDAATPDPTITNCIIGVPAHYGHAQRAAVKSAARAAGFTGRVGVMTESTAAAMAYGLFVSPPPLPREGPVATMSDSNAAAAKLGAGKGEGTEKNILVFDMGGGTTDVTVATISFGKGDAAEGDSDGSVKFRVVATAGDPQLGGDNVDEMLGRYLWNKRHAVMPSNDDSSCWKASKHRDFVRGCRRAKEVLCGTDGDGVEETHVSLSNEMIKVTRQDFDIAMRPLVERAKSIVDDAVSSFHDATARALSASGSNQHISDNNNQIHEVVLVGGSSHIPTIRSMLRAKFPPPIPPDLCTSISAETAVAQGLGIQAALVSGLLPLWELRNAMMLDVVPHTIGVWVGDHTGTTATATHAGAAPYTKGQIIQCEGSEGGQLRPYHFVPIIRKDDPLPAMGSATFTLASLKQAGISVVAVEQIGPGDTFQCMGVFDFLLHRLPSDDVDLEEETAIRQVDIGMSLDTAGKFIVSVFDSNDPEHREKWRRYLEERKKAGVHIDAGTFPNEVEDYFVEEANSLESMACSGTEIALAIFGVIAFAFYVAARVVFHDVEHELLNNSDEL